MSAFDVNLIYEFKCRPGFYDKNSPHYKDKMYNAQAWQEVSINLGYDGEFALLKDRMLQLRNRYNLEKRRLEDLAKENPGQVVHSQWPLFEQLEFLSTHIKPRRSFRRIMPRRATDGFLLKNQSSSSRHLVSSPELKSEKENEDTNENGNNLDDGDIQYSGNGCALPDYADDVIPSNHVRTVRTRTRMSSPIRRKRSHPDSMQNQKYNAFGSFIMSSLIEMPENKALLLIEKFTSALVRELLEQNHETDDSSVDIVDD